MCDINTPFFQALCIHTIQSILWRKSHSKSRSCKDIEYHHYGKNGHIKHDFYAWKREQKGKRQDTNISSHKEEPQKTKSTVKIEEINTITNDSDDDILIIENDSPLMIVDRQVVCILAIIMHVT